MTLRPAAASWFELLTTREELASALDSLARTGVVQLQAHSRATAHMPVDGLREILEQYAVLERRCGRWWPAGEVGSIDVEHPLVDTARAALEAIESWQRDAQPIIDELESVAVEGDELAMLERLVAAAAAPLPRLDLMARAGPVLGARVYALPETTPAPAVPASVLQQYLGDVRNGTGYLLAVGCEDDLRALDAAASATKARRIHLPATLPADPTRLAQHLQERLAALDQRHAAARGALAQLDERHGLARARGELIRVAWFVAHVPELPVTEHFAWITGWCAARDDSRLRLALDASGLHYLLRTLPAPAGAIAPSVLRNPRWARPFEALVGMMGVPAADDADPSVVVAILAPIMFGFMFGDVVQGACVAAAGYWLGRRMPALRLLLPGGIAAIGVGLLFGSVLAREDILPALWVHPLDQPLTILTVALAFGVVAILIGLALDAMQRTWHGALRQWLEADAGLVLAYCGIALAVLDRRALWALPVGMTWPVVMAALTHPAGRAVAAGRAAGEGLERLFQVCVNTVSFVRVGAFALAHAGLCAAIVGLAEIAGPVYWPVLVLGNAGVVALEGLVVSTQTTRLVLFEFFSRFLTASGRRFEPLAPPPLSIPGGKS